MPEWRCAVFSLKAESTGDRRKPLLIKLSARSAMSRLPKFADEVPSGRRSDTADTEFRLGPLSCFVLGFVAGIAAILVFGDTNILRFYIINAFH